MWHYMGCPPPRFFIIFLKKYFGFVFSVSICSGLGGTPNAEKTSKNVFGSTGPSTPSGPGETSS